MAKKRTINEIRQVKDSVYEHPHQKRHPDLTEVEQNLLDELNYKAKLILDIESMFKSNKLPCNTEALYEFDVKKLESILLVWNK